jgi:hypothetical protein
MRPLHDQLGPIAKRPPAAQKSGGAARSIAFSGVCQVKTTINSRFGGEFRASIGGDHE